MVNMTLSIPEELHNKMRQFNEVRWTEVARKAIEQRIQDLEVMDKIVSKSKLTKKDASELAEKIKKSASKRFLRVG